MSSYSLKDLVHCRNVLLELRADVLLLSLTVLLTQLHRSRSRYLCLSENNKAKKAAEDGTKKVSRGMTFTTCTCTINPLGAGRWRLRSKFIELLTRRVKIALQAQRTKCRAYNSCKCLKGKFRQRFTLVHMTMPPPKLTVIQGRRAL